MADLRPDQRVRFGQAFFRGEYPSQARYLSGFWASAGRASSAGWMWTKSRWASLNDTSGVVSGAEFEEVVEGRDIPYRDGMTRQQLDARIAEYDHDQYRAAFQDRPVAEFIGFMGPTLFDPVNLATLPVGGANFARAASASTLRQALRHSAVGGAKVGIASTPVEVALQQRAYGEIRPDELLASTAAPIALSPLLLAPTRALRGLTQRQLQRRFDAARNIDNPHQLSEAAVRGIDDDLVPPPPVSRVDTLGNVPTARVSELFSEYEGGVSRWLRDLAEGADAARAYASARGIDPDALPLRDLLTRQARLTAIRSAPPAEQRFTQVQDLLDAARGKATPEQQSRLREAGLTAEAEALEAAARATEGGRIPIEATTAADARMIARLEAERAEYALREEFAELAEALMTPDFARTHPQRLAVTAFMEQGAEGVTARRVNALEREYGELLDSIAALQDDLAGRRGRKPQAKLDELEALRGRRVEVAAEVEQLSATLRRVDDQVPLEDILDALDAARMESPAPSRPTLSEASPEAATRALLDEDAELAAMAAELSRQGFDLADAEALALRVTEQVKECGA